MSQALQSTEMHDNSVARYLCENYDKIESAWIQKTRQLIPGARAKSEEFIANDIPKLLRLLCEVLTNKTYSERKESLIKLASSHGEHRLRWEGYSFLAIIREYHFLEDAIFSVLESKIEIPNSDRALIREFIDLSIEIAAQRFSEVQSLRKERERQYLKLLETIVLKVADFSSLRQGLEHLLEVVSAGLNAQTSAIFIFQKENLQLTISAASTDTVSLVERYKAALAHSDLIKKISSSTESILELKIDELAPALQASFKLQGVRRLVLLRLDLKSKQLGVLCLGFRTEKQFDAFEFKLLNEFTARLALLLDHMQTFESSKEALKNLALEREALQIARAEMLEEQKQHDAFMSAVTHDLRNPLTAVKATAELITQAPHAPEATPEILAKNIVKYIDRSDQMIQDLLDSNHLKAGKTLSLPMQEMNMKTLVEEVLHDFEIIYGSRFRFHCESDVVGYWNREGMRRAIENLLTNAIKYGKPDAPITISIKKESDRMKLSVHNEGAPISNADQKKLFQPYQRIANGQNHGIKGWGIGLTLVRGVVEAHGGTVSVTSTPEAGTEFTINNPMDSRRPGN